MKTLTVLVVLHFAMFFSFTVVAQDTIYIPADYPTIQQGINAANNGDIVLVADGLYYENINFRGKAITVASHFLIDGQQSHINSTIINGSQPTYPDSASVVTFRSGEDTNSILIGFKITGGGGTYLQYAGNEYRKVGGGIVIFNSGGKIQYNVIESNTINFNSDASGGGIGAHSNSNHKFIIENNRIVNNSINTSSVTYFSTGGGIYTYTQGYVRIVNNKVLNNSITAPIAYGGGIVPAGAGNNNYFIINNLVSGNIVDTAIGGSGGIDVYNHNPVIKNNLIIFNSAPTGGGLLIESASPIFSNNTIANNTATVSGGGINIISANPSLMNCIIWGNTAPTGSQINGTADVSYSDVEGGFTGTGNINQSPEFVSGSEFYLLSGTSPCIDAGNPSAQYNDVEDPQNPGYALWPALGTLTNDMGHFGGPASLWGYWNWPLPVELTSFTATSNGIEVILNWTTATETNNQGFEIERSVDNVSFNKIGFVPGFGTTTEPKTYSYSDQSVKNGTFYYRLKQVDYDGSYEYSDVVEVNLNVPTEYSLHQNFPNPFNPSTKIKYSVPQTSQVQIKVFDVLGNEIETLVKEEKPTGTYELTWNAANLPSGIYFYRLRAGSFVETKKMVLMK